MREVKKIVAIGPESTGKSTLCQSLAAHYNTFWCPEYAREYLLTHGTGYTYEDLLKIAKGQLALEGDFIKRLKNFSSDKGFRRLLFCDTDMYVIKVWCEYVFQKCHPFILAQVAEQKVDLYLLCNTDLPWIKDELREYPDPVARNELYNIYKDILINQNVPWAEIRGKFQQRIQTAIAAINQIILI